MKFFLRSYLYLWNTTNGRLRYAWRPKVYHRRKKFIKTNDKNLGQICSTRYKFQKEFFKRLFLGEPGWPKYTSEGSGSCNLKFLIKEFNHVDSLKLRGGTPIEGRVQLWKDEYEKILKSFMI